MCACVCVYSTSRIIKPLTTSAMPAFVSYINSIVFCIRQNAISVQKNMYISVYRLSVGNVVSFSNLSFINFKIQFFVYRRRIYPLSVLFPFALQQSMCACLCTMYNIYIVHNKHNNNIP